MKWFHLLPVAAVLTLAVSALADEIVRPKLAAETQAGLPLQMAAGGQTRYADYPAEAYPMGFSSYRGTGFMGSCCEQIAPDAACLWKDYCETKDHHAKLFDGLGHGWKPGCGKPVGVPVVADCGSGCCGPGTNLRPKHACLPPIGERLRCLKANVCGLFPSLPPANCSGCEAGSRATPTLAADPAPVPPELPAPPGPTPSADPVPALPEAPTPPTPTPSAAPAAALPEAPTPPAPAAEADPAPVPPSLPTPPAADKTTHLPPPMLNAPWGASLVIPRPSPQDKSASRMEPRVLRAWTVSF